MRGRPHTELEGERGLDSWDEEGDDYDCGGHIITRRRPFKPTMRGRSLSDLNGGGGSDGKLTMRGCPHTKLKGNRGLNS